MALTKTITLQNNFGDESTFDNAYLRVDRVEGSKALLTAHVGFYKKDRASLLLTSSVSFKPSLEGGNFIKQAYEYIKTLPEFADATNC
jgi:hypothetical protein